MSLYPLCDFSECNTQILDCFILANANLNKSSNIKCQYLEKRNNDLEWYIPAEGDVSKDISRPIFAVSIMRA